MIDRLRSMARSAQRLALPSAMLALLLLAYVLFVVFTSTSVEGDKYLFPSILGLLWMLSVYAFLETFRYVPDRAEASSGFLARIKRKLSRLWYWVVGIVFLLSTAAVAVFSVRVLLVWFRTYAN